jgi:transcription termination factor Rho
VAPFDGPRGERPERQDREDRSGRGRRRNRQRGRQGRDPQERPPVAAVTPDTTLTGWLDIGRDGGYVRLGTNSYLAHPSDAFVPQHLMRQYSLRKGDALEVQAGRDSRGRMVVAEVTALNGADPQADVKRPDFQALLATYPDRKLKLETGKARGGPEITRRVVDLIAPVGYGQRALIVAPARSGKTMLLQAIVEGVALNHPDAHLLVLLVDERPEEVSEMVAVGYGEVVASSFDMPAARHRDVVEMVMERARRLVEVGSDVVIVLDSITRMARAFNTVERGIGRTLSGGLDATAMAKPKAFFGSARAVAPKDGGGSLTIIATALVETGSRMDDVIFEEFKGTGNCEIKLDRSLAERRIYPAIDIPASGTRREDKLFRPEQLDAVYLLRRGLQQLPASAAMEWLIKRIAATRDNDSLLAGLKDA